MGSLIAGFTGVVDGLSRMAGDGSPNAPSTPVEIGTSGTHHSRSQIGSWQDLFLMLAVVIAIGTVVLLFVVRQRVGLLERRRLRRMAEAAARTGDTGDSGDWDEAAAPAPPPTMPATPGRSAPNA
jgi:hypothetical protein